MDTGGGHPPIHPPANPYAQYSQHPPYGHPVQQQQPWPPPPPPHVQQHPQQQQQQHYYPHPQHQQHHQQHPPPPGDYYSQGPGAGLQGFTSQAPSRAAPPAQPQPQLVRNVQSRHTNQHIQQHRSQHSQSPYEHHDSLSPSVGGWQGNSSLGPPHLSGPPSSLLPHDPHQQPGEDLKPSVSIHPPGAGPGMNRPNSAASARSARPRTGGSGASDKRAGPAGAGAKKGAKAAAPFGSDDEDGDEGGTNGSGGPGQVKGKAANNGPSDFVKKLFKMLSDSEYNDVVAWSSSEDSFIVKDMNEFTTRILPQTFRHSNFASFVRQLNKYDFHKVKAEEGGHVETTWEFKHPQFNSNSAGELDQIKRKIPVPKKAAASKESAVASTPLTTNVPLVPNGNGGFVPLDQAPPGSAGPPLGMPGGLQPVSVHPSVHSNGRLSVPPPSATSSHFPHPQPSPSTSSYPLPPSSPHPPSSQAPHGFDPSAFYALQNQVRELQAGHASMYQHVQTLHTKYQKIIADLVALQRSSTSTEALVGDVVNYLVQMENEQRASQDAYTPASSSSEPSTVAASGSFRPSYNVSPQNPDLEAGAISPTSGGPGSARYSGDSGKGKSREDVVALSAAMGIDVPKGWDPSTASSTPSNDGPSNNMPARPDTQPYQPKSSTDHSANNSFGLSETLFAEFIPGGSFSAESITGTKRGLENTPGPDDGDGDDGELGGVKRFRGGL